MLSLGGMIVPKYLRTRSGYSRTAVSMSQNSTPALEVLAVAVKDDLGLVLGGHPRQVLALGLGDAQALVGVLDRVGQVLPVVDLVLGGLDVVVDVVEVQVRHVLGEPGIIGFFSKR